MPFTFSHPAIVLPLKKIAGKWMSLTGLIIGSIVPDFEYFFRMKIQSNISHTVIGLLYFDLPIGILLSFVFHNIIRNSLYYNLPIALKSRVEIFTTFDWNTYFKSHFLIVILSIMIGAISHLLWDDFTHIHGYFVQTLPVLKNHITIAGFSIAAYKILQHASSLIGGLCIIIAFINMPKHPVTHKNISKKYWLSILIISVVIIMIRMILGNNDNYLSQLIVTGISAFILALIITHFWKLS